MYYLLIILGYLIGVYSTYAVIFYKCYDNFNTFWRDEDSRNALRVKYIIWSIVWPITASIFIMINFLQFIGLAFLFPIRKIEEYRSRYDD